MAAPGTPKLGDTQDKMMRWAEKQHGKDIWARMLANLHKIHNSKTKNNRHVWEFINPSDVRCACVWGSGTSRCQQAEPVTAEEAGCWWPALVSTSSGWRQKDCVPVLCEPLLENQCREPWMTHVSRIVVLQGLVANPAQGPPPPPPAALASPSASTSSASPWPSSVCSNGSSWQWESGQNLSSGPPSVSSGTSDPPGSCSTVHDGLDEDLVDWEVMD